MTEVCCMQSCKGSFVHCLFKSSFLTLRGSNRGFKKEDSGPNYVTPLGLFLSSFSYKRTLSSF